MYCEFCGEKLQDESKFCHSCGKQQIMLGDNQDSGVQVDTKRIGFSSRINDPSFKRYVKSSNYWAAIFSMVIAVAAVVGFIIAGEMGVDNLSNPEALYIGLVIGSMFIIIALFQIVSRKRSYTWDGTIVDKTIEMKTRSIKNEENRYEDYLEYKVAIKSDSGKNHIIRSEDDDTLYNYYKIGDRIRHHGGLNSYEKYDKSGDEIVFCNACATLCDINDDFCFRCKCPLLK